MVGRWIGVRAALAFYPLNSALVFEKGPSTCKVHTSCKIFIATIRTSPQQEEEFIPPRIQRSIEQPNHKEGADVAGPKDSNATWLYYIFACLSLLFSLQLQSGFPETWPAIVSPAGGRESDLSFLDSPVKNFQGRSSLFQLELGAQPWGSWLWPERWAHARIRTL